MMTFMLNVPKSTFLQLLQASTSDPAYVLLKANISKNLDTPLEHAFAWVQGS